MTRLEHLIAILAEECDETGQHALKGLRFGLHEIQEGQPLKNHERITYEFNDILAMMEILKEEGYISIIIDREAISKKKQKVEKYLEYCKKIGTLKEEVI